MLGTPNYAMLFLFRAVSFWGTMLEHFGHLRLSPLSARQMNLKRQTVAWLTWPVWAASCASECCDFSTRGNSTSTPMYRVQLRRLAHIVRSVLHWLRQPL